MKRALLILLFCTLGSFAWSQATYSSSGQKQMSNKATKKKGLDKSKLIVGGGLGGDYNRGMLQGILSPIVGYRFNDLFAAGISIGYQYSWIENGTKAMDPITGLFEERNQHIHIFTPGIWGRLAIWKNLFLHTEIEYNFLSFNRYQTNLTDKSVLKVWEKHTTPCLLLGGGYRMPITEKSSLTITLLYDVLRFTGLQNNAVWHPYNNRLTMRIGFNLGY